MEGSSDTEILDAVGGDPRAMRCEIRFRLISKFIEGFGDRFDDLEFPNYETGGVVKGAALRDAQTGCEIYELQGWNSAEHNQTGHFNCGCKQFDEQLCFVSEEGKPLSNTDYRVTLGDGRTVSGTTDNDGKTKRIKNTNKEQPIEKVEFFVSEHIQPLCPRNPVQPGKRVKKIKPSGVTTTKENIGSSVKTVTVEGAARKLTSGEIAMLRPIFKDSIYYSEVRVHNEDWLPFGMQDDETIMTPNGQLYCPKAAFREDYSALSKKEKDIKGWFMHEMTHVWQWNRGYRGRILVKGALYGIATKVLGQKKVYGYDLETDNNKKFSDFNMEQQGDLIEHYYRAKYLGDIAYTYQLPFLEHILAEFLKEPRAVALLPGG